MSSPSLVEPESRNTTPKKVYSLPDYDDDDDDDDADFDDDESVSLPRNEGWLSHSGFASPEWWSRV
jgi:hypothetical protein